MEMDATDSLAKAGIYLTNGNQKVMARLYSTYDNGNKLVLQCDTAIRIIPNPFGKTVWLKIERNGHELYGYYSSNGKTWMSAGLPVSTINLDKTQPNYNSWVGTSVGLLQRAKWLTLIYLSVKTAILPCRHTATVIILAFR